MNKSRKIVFGLVVVIAVAVIFQNGRTVDNTKPNGEKGVIKIGAILPLTGNSAFFGKSISNGIALAKKHSGKMGEKINIIIEDSQGDPKQGLNAYQKIITSNPNTNVFLVSMVSIVNALIPVIDEDNKLLFVTGATAPKLPTKSENMFRFFLTSDIDVKVAAEFITKNLSAKNIAVLFINEEGGIAYANEFSEQCKQYGMNIVYSEGIVADQRDFRQIIEKLSISNADLVYLIFYTDIMGVLIKQLREKNFQGEILAIFTAIKNEVSGAAGTAINGVYFTSDLFDIDSKRELMKKFVNRYEEEYHCKPDYYAAYAYDLFQMLVQAYESGCKTNDDIKKYMVKSTFSGIMGDELQFNVYRDCPPIEIIKQFKDGKIVIINGNNN